MIAHLKKYIPPSLLKILRPVYHGTLAILASVYYHHPSKKMTVIGITGTAGKSTTAAMLSAILNFAGKKCGFITTVNFFDGEKNYLNKNGMSMPGGPRLQKYLSVMLKNNCQYAIVECTSEGLAQNRHLGIKFKVALFTNLSAAHIEAHNGFENYRAAKAKLFSKGFKVQGSGLSIIGVNLDDTNAEYFLKFDAADKFGISFKPNTLLCSPPGGDARRAERVTEMVKIFNATKTQNGFNLHNENFSINLLGDFNKYNALLASACANILGVNIKVASQALANFKGIRGRMEEVENNKGIKIIVDYGCEPASFKAALKAASAIPHKKLIHVFGSTGGHRDILKRFEFGKTSAQFSDYIIVTNDDVYETNPQTIANDIETGIMEAVSGQRSAVSFEIILDRKEAIKKALSIAQKDDLVLITGKGSEQFLILPGNKKIYWDDVGVVKKILSN